MIAGPQAGGGVALPSLGDAPWLTAPSTQTTLKLLEDAGFEARVVGGAVRNALLGHSVRDLDIATTALPEEVIAAAETKGLRVVPTGLKHGTVTVVVNGEGIEVTTLREDVATDGRHAEVRFTTTWSADASRRDFTINALYCDAGGRLHDPLSGYPDIVSRRIRFIGNARLRIEEDYLRILRFFRFFAEYGSGPIDEAGMHACVMMRHGLRRLSGERLRQELMKLLVAPRMLEAIEAMQTHGLLGEILPTAPRLSHLARLVGCEPSASATLRLACMSIHTREDAEKVSRRLRLSNAEYDVLRDVARTACLRPVPSIPLAKHWLYELGLQGFQERVSYLNSSCPRHLADMRWHEMRDLPSHWPRPEFPIAGRDVIAAGIRPGPEIGELLSRLESAWKASDFELTREELIQRLEAYLK